MKADCLDITTGIGELSVFNPQGNLVRKLTEENRTIDYSTELGLYKLNLSDLKSGFYIVNISDNKDCLNQSVKLFIH